MRRQNTLLWTDEFGAGEKIPSSLSYCFSAAAADEGKPHLHFYLGANTKGADEMHAAHVLNKQDANLRMKPRGIVIVKKLRHQDVRGHEYL